MSNKRTHFNRIAKAVEKKAKVVIHDKCEGYGCDECCGMGCWTEREDRFVRTVGKWISKILDEHWRQQQGWDRIDRQLHARIDAMNKRLEAACDYLHVPFADQKPPKTIIK